MKRRQFCLVYSDIALTPVTDGEIETLELFHTPAAEAYVANIARAN